MAIKVSVTSNPKNRVSISKQDTNVNIISSPKNRVSINKQDRTVIRSVGISYGAYEEANTATILAGDAYDQANLATNIAVTSFNYANSLALGAATSLVNLTDVDATSVDNNETLVYDQGSGKFVVKELPIVNGGTF